MKKILMILLMMLTIVGCGRNKDVKVKLDYEKMPSITESSPYLYSKYSLLSKELESTEEYDEKIANKDSFVMFVYLNTCYGCNLLAPALKEYVNENNLVIYTLSYSVISDNHNLYEEGINTTPYLVLIKEGKIEYKELVELPQNKSEHVNWVNEWMEKHIEWSEN